MRGGWGETTNSKLQAKPDLAFGHGHRWPDHYCYSVAFLDSLVIVWSRPCDRSMDFAFKNKVIYLLGGSIEHEGTHSKSSQVYVWVCEGNSWHIRAPCLGKHLN